MADTTNTPPSSTEAAARLAAAQAAEASAVATLAGLLVDQATARELADRRTLAVLRTKINEAEDEIGITRAAVPRAEVELQVALAREEQDRRLVAYQAAIAKRAVAEKLLVSKYPDLARKIMDIVRERAESDALIENVNRSLPENARPIQLLSDEYFAYARTPRKDLETETLDLWVRDFNGTIVPDEYQGKYIDQGDGTGISGSGRDRSTATKKKVRRTKYLPEISGNYYEGFSNRLCLPGLANEKMYYEPAYSDVPANVLSALKTAEDRLANFKPPVRVPTYRDEILPEETLADA